MKVEHYHILHKTKSGLITSTKCDYKTLFETPKVGSTVRSHYGERVEFYNFEYGKLNDKNVMYQDGEIVEITDDNLLERVKLYAGVYMNALYNLNLEDLNTSFRDEPSFIKNVEYGMRDFIEKRGSEFDIRYSKINLPEKDIVELLKNAYNELTASVLNYGTTLSDDHTIKIALNYSMTKVAGELDYCFDEDVVYTNLLTRENEEETGRELDTYQAELIGHKIYDQLSYENKKKLNVDLTANEKKKKNQKLKY